MRQVRACRWTWLPHSFRNNPASHFLANREFRVLFLGGVLRGALGDIAGGVISDETLPRTRSVVAARQNVIAISLLGGLAFLAPLLFSHNLMTVTACLAGASFFSELTIGPI